MDNVTEPNGSKSDSKRSKRLVIKIILGVVIIALIVVLTPVVRAGWIFYRHGMFASATGMRQYHGDRTARLKAIQTALMQYQTSEGQFPLADGWMKAIEDRIQSNDMQKSQSQLKLHDPSVTGSGYGWGFNKALSGKYIGDIKDPDGTVLVYTSKDTQYNDAGDPKSDVPNPPRDGENLGITVSGKIVKL